MALGLYEIRGRIDTNGVTFVIAAPGERQRVYLYTLDVLVAVAGVASRLVIENGHGGQALGRMSTISSDTAFFRNYSINKKGYEGRALDENTALVFRSVGTSPASIDYSILYEVRG